MNKEVDENLKRLYEGVDIEKLEQPKDHSKILYGLTVIGGIFWLIAILYIWYLINV